MSKNKKTIYFSTYDDIKNPYYGGGGAIAVHQTAKQLTKKYTVRVVSWDYSGKKKEVIDGVAYERFGMPFINHKAAMFIYQLALPFVAMSKSYDMWMESFCPPFTTAFLPRFTPKPVVGIVHMLAAEDMERKYKLPFHLIQNVGLKTYTHIIVTSDTMKKKVKKINPSVTLTTLSNGIDAVYRPTKIKEKYLLFLGRIEVDQKGIDLLLSAFKEFYDNNKEYKLVLAGSGDTHEVAKLKKVIQDKELSKCVVLKGRVNGKMKDTLLRNASCLVISSRFETYSLVALEAMSQGTPIVCFSIEGLSWIPQTIAKKVKPFSVTRFSKAFTDIISDKEETTVMIQNGTKYARQFTWEKIGKEYGKYIEEITKEVAK